MLFGKILILLILPKKNLKNNFIFFLAIFTFLRAALDVQQNFMPTKYCFYLSISVTIYIKCYGGFFFVNSLPKLNILSVIAID